MRPKITTVQKDYAARVILNASVSCFSRFDPIFFAAAVSLREVVKALEPALSTRLTLAHVPLMYFFRRGPFVRPKITTVPVFFVFALNCALVAPSIIIIINPNNSWGARAPFAAGGTHQQVSQLCRKRK